MIDYKHYKSSTQCYRKKVSSSLGSSTYEICDIINGEYITYYKTYQWRAFEDNITWFSIYVDKFLYDILREIYTLDYNFSLESIEKSIKDYPNLISVWCHNRNYGNESISSGIDDSRYGLGSDANPTCNLTIIAFGSPQDINSDNYYLSLLLEKYNLLKKECANFHYSTDALEISDYRKFEMEIEKMEKINNNTPPKKRSKLEKYLILAGVFGLKFAVRSIGGDINIDVPIDADVDIDVDADLNLGNDSSIPISDASNLLGADNSAVDFDADNDTSVSNGYNVSFGAQKETLTSRGGGQHLDVTIEKEPGTANSFTISSKKGTVSGVSGSENWVKISGILYKLPKLKG